MLRTEAQILEDLKALTKEAGYVHAVANISHRDNVIYVKEALKPSDMDGLFRPERLNRSELNTLIGLMVKSPLDDTLPSQDVLQAYIERTDELLKELHESMASPMWMAMAEAKSSGELQKPWDGMGMREPIFYASESAYAFQYRDFVPDKYQKDDSWLLKTKGFTAEQAKKIAKSMCDLTEEKAESLFAYARTIKALPISWLPANELSLEEVIAKSGCEKAVVEAFFQAFTFTGDNQGFKEIGDFNEVAARPLISTKNGKVLLFSHYAIYEALYESPFYWMLDDKSYKEKAAKHRGEFVEQFAARRLSAVFPSRNVYTNVNLFRGKEIVAEADVMVIYGDRLIIVQAKAKKLTIAARKGNNNQLKSDFSAAIQDSYNQGWTCATEIIAGGCRLEDASKNEVELPKNIREVFLFSLISENYPALAFQALESLKFQTTDVIRAPFVMDVFLLDTLTEMLATPLRLISYVKQRVLIANKLVTGHELTVLSYHLKNNLWFNDEHSLIMLDDSIASDLDAAMMVRRDNLPGEDTPQGILTKLRGTLYERVIAQIEKNPNPSILEAGFHLLSLNEEACINVHRLLATLMRKTLLDGKRHDAALASSEPPSGIIFHCNPTVTPEAIEVLRAHCIKRKYTLRAPQWFGLSVSPEGQVQFGVTLDFPWEYSEEMELLTKDMKPITSVRDVLPQFTKGADVKKVGRNDPCPCGSTLKYKKCCL